MSRPLALVTGASRGIGRAIADALARTGYDLVLVATDAAALERVATELAPTGATVRVLPLDLTDPDAAERGVAALGIERLDLLVNNAAVIHDGVLAGTSSADFTQAFAVNVTSPAAFVRALTPALRVAHGTVVMINSGAGRHPFADKPVYVASKFALQGLTDSLRLDLGPQGIRVVTVAPGPTDTRDSAPDDVRRAKLAPADVASTVLHVVAHPGDLEYVSVRPPVRRTDPATAS